MYLISCWSKSGDKS